MGPHTAGIFILFGMEYLVKQAEIYLQVCAVNEYFSSHWSIGSVDRADKSPNSREHPRGPGTVSDVCQCLEELRHQFRICLFNTDCYNNLDVINDRRVSRLALSIGSRAEGRTVAALAILAAH